MTAFAVGCTGTVDSVGGGSNPPPVKQPMPAVPGLEFECNDDGLDPGPSLVRRLTVSEYVNSVRAVLGVDIENAAVQAIPADLRADGFSNTAGALVVTLEHIAAYESLAANAVSQLPDLSAFVGNYVECSETDDACGEELVRGLGAVVLRGPVRDEELQPLQTLFSRVVAEGGDFNEVSGVVLQAMLQSPRFIYRVENERGTGIARDLDGYEVASRLSYLVLSGPPDSELMAAAERDELRTDAQIEAHVRRMFQQPEARTTSLRYLGDWLHLDRLNNVARDSGRFPDWDPALGSDMRRETEALFEWLVWEEDRPISDLFNAQRTFVSRRLAEHYGLPDPQDGDQWYDVDNLPERGGVLTQGSIHTLGGNTASMVTRGLFILETVLCGHLQSPPPGTDTTQRPTEPGRSQRFYSEERVENPSCGGCHRQMEPLAWGLERFDPTGRFVAEDEAGNVLGESGTFLAPGEDPVEYTNVGELMELFAGSARARDCVQLKTTQFALGRTLEETDGCSLEATRAEFLGNGGTYQELLISLAKSPLLRRVRVEP
ncbi:MAG: DUF1592 domain-containing protein [Myxococcota bacterium]